MCHRGVRRGALERADCGVAAWHKAASAPNRIGLVRRALAAASLVRSRLLHTTAHKSDRPRKRAKNNTPWTSQRHAVERPVGRRAPTAPRFPPGSDIHDGSGRRLPGHVSVLYVCMCGAEAGPKHRKQPAGLEANTPASQTRKRSPTCPCQLWEPRDGAPADRGGIERAPRLYKARQGL